MMQTTSEGSTATDTLSTALNSPNFFVTLRASITGAIAPFSMGATVAIVLLLCFASNRPPSSRRAPPLPGLSGVMLCDTLQDYPHTRHALDKNPVKNAGSQVRLYHGKRLVHHT